MILQTNEGRAIFRHATVILWLVVFSLGMYLEWPAHFERRFADLSTLSDALESYRRDHGVFPVSNGSSSLKPDWIPELVPKYLAAVPQDPRYLFTVQNKQYLYISNGERSYSIYLFHIFVYAAATHVPAAGVPTVGRIAVLWATVFASAHILYQFIEMPVRKKVRDTLLAAYPAMVRGWRRMFA